MDDTLLELTATPPTPLWMYALYVALALVVLLLIAWGVSKLKGLFGRPELYGLSRAEIQKRWLEIRKTSQQGQMGAKLAVMEADTLLDAALKSMAMPGETLGERLKMACYSYPDLRDVWWAHKIRNQLVHESSFVLQPRMAKQALDEFEKALKTLKLM